MQGLMQHRQLLISTLLRHAENHHGDTDIVSQQVDGSTFRYTYAEAARRARQLAKALKRLGVGPGDRVGTLAWNTHRHFELYYAVSGSGAVAHTINPRLFIAQIEFICRHAEDKVVFFDLSFVDIVSHLAARCPSVRHWVALCDSSARPDDFVSDVVLCYEDLVAAEDDAFAWPDFDENTASALCYTSGTTGDPKGVLYSHRSTVLHAYASATPDCFDLSAADVVMPASSMYHANAWGLPYAITMVGAKLVLSCNKLDGESLTDLVNREGVTLSSGVPTIWLGVAQHLERSGARVPTLRSLVIGGAACPAALMTTFREAHGVEVVHLWGMTETSPLGTVNRLKTKHAGLSATEADDIRAKQGRVVYGVELDIVGESGEPVAHDGVAYGDLMVRGWWISSGYFGDEQPAVNAEGWFHTGDVATLDADGYMKITDRSKDVIKSGGEWISSIDLENAAVGHPQIAEAAVIGVRHPKWDERPLLIVVPKSGQSLDAESVRDFLRDKVAKWWMPDDIVFIDEIPHTATGKILKTELRKRYADHLIGTNAA